MKIYLIAALAAGVLIVACGPGRPEEPTISASGQGSVTLRPVRASMALDVDARQKTPTQASTLSSERARKVLAALRAGHLADSIQVSDVDLSETTDQQDNPTGFEGMVTIRFQTRSLDSIGAILESALAAGSTSIRSITFEADSVEAARARALALAFEHAKHDASILAQASGHRLGRLLAETTAREGYFAPNGFEDASVAIGRSEVLTLQPGVISSISPTPRGVVVSAGTSARWELTD